MGLHANRRRLSKQESKKVALAAARAILIEEGPQSVTLKAVAARIDRTHANLLHHFGSAQGLQLELAELIGQQITTKIRDTVSDARRGEADPVLIVNLTFDAFAKEGAGPLASWMILNGDAEALSPILKAINSLVNDLTDADHPNVAQTTLALVLAALGDALLGGPMASELNLPRDTARKLALQQLISMGGADYQRRSAA